MKEEEEEEGRSRRVEEKDREMAIMDQGIPECSVLRGACHRLVAV